MTFNLHFQFIFHYFASSDWMLASIFHDVYKMLSKDMSEDCLEIERKFLVKNFDFIDDAFDKYEIKQGYLSTNNASTVRVRVCKNKGYITIKGRSFDNGISKKEWEYEIPYDHALQLLNICSSNILEKTRYLVSYENILWEIDVFSKPNNLVIAEVELKNKDEYINKPSWIGEEVTGKKEYYNSYISKQ